MENNIPVVLVAEDNESNFFLLATFLKKGYKVVRAVDGADAVEIVKESRPDIILMDIKMPIMNGLEATKAIRAFDKTLPIIALTAHAFESDKQAALQAGCTDFLSKPIYRETLMQALVQYGFPPAVQQ